MFQIKLLTGLNATDPVSSGDILKLYEFNSTNGVFLKKRTYKQT